MQTKKAGDALRSPRPRSKPYAVSQTKGPWESCPRPFNPAYTSFWKDDSPPDQQTDLRFCGVPGENQTSETRCMEDAPSPLNRASRQNCLVRHHTRVADSTLALKPQVLSPYLGPLRECSKTTTGGIISHSSVLVKCERNGGSRFLALTFRGGCSILI